MIQKGKTVIEKSTAWYSKGKSKFALNFETVNILLQRRSMVVDFASDDSTVIADACGPFAGFSAATFDSFDPAIVHHFVHCDPSIWVRVEHQEYQTPKRSGAEASKESSMLRMLIPCHGAVRTVLNELLPPLGVASISGILCFRSFPWSTAVDHGKTGDAARPYIKQPWIIVSYS